MTNAQILYLHILTGSVNMILFDRKRKQNPPETSPGILMLHMMLTLLGATKRSLDREHSDIFFFKSIRFILL